MSLRHVAHVCMRLYVYQMNYVFPTIENFQSEVQGSYRVQTLPFIAVYLFVHQVILNFVSFNGENKIWHNYNYCTYNFVRRLNWFMKLF